MSNSPLVSYTRISQNKSSPRNHKIDTVTIHCTSGNMNNTAEQIANLSIFSKPGFSCNYAIGGDGSIALVVDERDRSWCSSSRDNDNRAITIEVATSKEHPFPCTDLALESLVILLSDICKRNGIKSLLWENDKSKIGEVGVQNMTAHRWFANKKCPGDFLFSRYKQIAEEVNSILNNSIGSDYSKEAREWAIKRGIFIGDENGDFNWKDPVTREQLAVILHRYNKEEK